MNPKLPILAILPLQSLIIHENHDASRSEPLAEKIRSSVIFTNPVIVAPLHDHTARYIVLDGTNRTTALRKLGYDHILAQVVEPDELGVEIQTWNHVVWDIPAEEFLAGMQTIEGLEFNPSRPDRANDTVVDRQGLAAVHLADGRAFEIHAPAAGIAERNRLLNAIVDSYKDRGCLDRTNQRAVDKLKAIYPDLSGLVLMPRLRIRHLITLAGQGQLIPPGVTRFTISPRALRVNFPMDILAGDLDLEEKNERLAAFIRLRASEKGIRYYAEETILYDE